MRRIICVGALAASLSAVGGSVAIAGQPNVSCQNPAPGQISNPPPGQLLPGFLAAADRYAGSPDNPTITKGVGNPDHAISQYDISCYGGRSSHP